MRLKKIRLSIPYLLCCILFFCCSTFSEKTTTNSDVVENNKISENKGTHKTLTQLEIARMYSLCKIWGFVKYHHPEVAKGAINWDEKLFEILPSIKSSDFNSKLYYWLNSINNIDNTNLLNPLKTYYNHNNINNNWINDEKIVPKEIALQLKSIQTNKLNKNHYVSFIIGNGRPVFTNEKTYPNANWNENKYKLLTLFRYWNIIEYFYPYKYLIEENWDDILIDFIPKIMAAKDESSYKLIIRELIRKIGDTHADYIFENDQILESYFGINRAPILIEIIEDKLVVTDILESNANQHRIKVGDIITSIEGIDEMDKIKEISKYCVASNYPTLLRNICKRLLRTNKDSLKLKIMNERGTYLESIPCIPFNTPDFKNFKKLSHHTIGNIGYIFPGTLKKGEIHKVMKKFMNKKGIIIDFRCYPSDFIVFSLSNYLLPTPTEFVKFKKCNIQNPGSFNYTESEKAGNKNTNFYKGKVVILVNEKTQSQAEYTVMALSLAPKSTIIGSTTAGADGDVSLVTLPCGTRTYITGVGVYYPDGTETQKVGIIPNIVITPTIKGIREGKDEVLNKAINLINKHYE